jgi:hypothetical protein
MHRQFNRGSVAPLALLFTLVSMSFTAAYLKNSFSQSAMEKYRYAEWRALYSAEAGLNDVGIIILPQITSDTLLIQDGVDYGKDENNQPVGIYKDIACSTRLQINSTRKEYIAYATGVAEYTTPSGTDVSIERRVYATMVPQGFEEFMYFTHKEEPIGPGNTGVVNFGSGDQLEGKVHTNGVMTMSNYCNPGPTFTGEVNITFDAIDQNGNAINYGGCSEDIFEDDDGNTILDTVSTIIFPPSNSAEVARQSATRVFEADDKLFRPGKKDTLIMTEIEFVGGGYWATQWWYNIPPVGSPPAEYDFVYDSLSQIPNVDVDAGTLHLFANFYDGTTYPPNPDNGQNFLLVSAFDASGTNVQEEIIDLIEGGDIIRIQNEDGSKVQSFTANGATPFGDERIMVQFNTETFSYVSLSGTGFSHNETVKFINTSASTGLAEDVEWNSYNFYHDHLDNGIDFCEAGRIQHFDFEYWNYGGISGNGCDIFTCPNIIYNSEYVHMNRAFFSKGNSPQVIYVKGGQVLLRGTVDGLYTIVTDDYTEYRRHDNNDIIDRVWGNIWLIDDIVYADSYASGAVIHPMDGGTNHVLGLIAGGSVIIANTRPNGARDQQYGSNIKINASILAMHGGFISHYWQNTLADYHNPTYYTANGMTTVIADGRGGHRNYYRVKSSSPPNFGGLFTGDSDYRGIVRLYGSIVQFKRGYMKRNYPGPYPVNAPGLGYDKDYHYDWNLQLKPPPYFPDLETSDNTVILKMASYGEANSIE